MLEAGQLTGGWGCAASGGKTRRRLQRSPGLDFVLAALDGGQGEGLQDIPVNGLIDLEAAMSHGLTCRDSVWLWPGEHFLTHAKPPHRIFADFELRITMGSKGSGRL